MKRESMPEIPFELVLEILMRLPAKSLMKFKSVSKLWSSVICSRYFTTDRFLRPASAPPRLYMCLRFFDNSHESMLLSSSPSSDLDGATMSSFDADQYLMTISAMTDYECNVFRGLMCFVNGSSVQIYNTTTRQLVVLPDIEESSIIGEDHEIMNIMYHVGHDPVHDRYKVVCIAETASEAEDEGCTYLSGVLLLGGDGSSRWKKISCGSPPQFPRDQVLNINGRMHYISKVGMDYVLVVFDFNSEEFSMLQLPCKDTLRLDTGLIEYCGKIAILNNTWNLENGGVIDLWFMEDEEKNKWGLKTLVLHPSQMHMVNSIILIVQGTTPNGEVILAPQHTNNFHIFLYDLQKNHMRKIEIKATPNRHRTQYCEILGMEDVENLLYL